MPPDRHNHADDEDPSDVRFGEILNNFLDRQARGESVTEAELVASYPEFADELLDALGLVREIDSSRSEISDLVARGVVSQSTDRQYEAELGPYKIVHVVGRGGMGVVLKAYEPALGRFVALKILRPDLAQDQAVLGRFEREARAAAALRHPNIVTVHAVGAQHGTHYIAMEFVDGTTLAHMIRDHGWLPTETTYRILHEVLSGLSAAHSAGLIHRDIKPSNILLEGREQRARIADFGLARILGAHTRMTLPESALGTPEYMSPEQARGDLDTDHRSDLYSAGAVLYEMLTGHAPFRAETPTAVLHRVLHDDPPDPRSAHREVDPHLARIARRLMAKRPEDRFNSGEEVLAALDVTARVGLPERRRRLLHRAAGALAMIVLFAAAAWVAGRLSAPSPIITMESANDGVIAYANVSGDPEDRPAHLRPCVRVRYSNGVTNECFVDVSAIGGEVLDVALVPSLNRDDGNPRIAVALGFPVSTESLALYDSNRTIVWKKNMTPTEPITWPDLEGPLETWGCEAVAVLDDQRLVVAVHDGSGYPARVSVVRTSDAQILASYWHLGRIMRVEVVDGFFGAGRPAIIAWGHNNKLDGFGDPSQRPYEPLPGEEEPFTEYDIVPMIMILNPEEMRGGIGPPRTKRTGLTYERPYAYAFLDLPSGRERDATGHVPLRSEVAAITAIKITRKLLATLDRRILEIAVQDQNSPSLDRAGIHVDRHLCPVHVDPRDYDSHLTTAQDWYRHWYWMDEDGQFVRGDAPSREGAGSTGIRP